MPTDSLTRAVTKLDKNLATSLAMQRIDSLTKEEVDELRLLSSVGPGDVAATFARARIGEEGHRNQNVAGMYRELIELQLVGGFITSDGDIFVTEVTPLGHWAVERHDKLAQAEEGKVIRQHRHDYRVAIASSAVGGLLGILGTVLGILIGRFTV